MIDLLAAVKAKLEATAAFKRVFYSEYQSAEGDYVPRSFPLPAVGIKDRGEGNPEDRTAGGMTRFFDFRVVVYSPLPGRETGDGLMPILALGEQVRQALHRHCLGLNGICRYEGAEESTAIEFKARAAMRLGLNFSYELEG
jgi:hypothetical protein